MRVRLGHVQASSLGFFINTVCLGILAILYIPVQIRFAGLSAWTQLAVGQTVGAIANVVVGLGWVLDGPAKISRLAKIDAQFEYGLSVVARSCVFVLICLLMIIVLVVSRTDLQFFLLGLLGISVQGILGGWYFVGIGNGWLLVLLECIPRTLFTAIGIVGTGRIFGVTTGLWLQICGVLIAAVLSSWWILRGRSRSILEMVRWRLILQRVRDQRYAVGTLTVSTIYTSAPLLIVGWFFPFYLQQFSILDKFYKQAQTLVSPILQAYQGWLSREPRTLRLSLFGNIALSTIAFCGAAVGLTIVMPWLSSGAYREGFIPLLALSGALSLSFFGRVLVNGIFPYVGLTSVSFSTALLGGIVGCGLCAVLPREFGIAGAYMGLLFAELTVNIIRLWLMRPLDFSRAY